ncbi:MAG: TetR/AcrR family transcriptional regulator [Candidatus Lokiarchaeota archaeon]
MENKRKKNEKMSRKERETQLRRNIIIEAAEKLFLNQGYENTSMDEIAHASEFSKGTLYNYFNSKEDLYLVIAKKAYKILIELTKKFTQNEEPGMPQIKQIGYAYYEFTKKYPKYATVFHDIAIKIPDIESKQKKEQSQFEKDYLSMSYIYRDIFLSILEKAIKIGALRADKSPFLIAFVLSRLTNSLIKDLMHSKHIVKAFKLEEDQIVDFVFEIMEDGLKPREKANKT